MPKMPSSPVRRGRSLFLGALGDHDEIDEMAHCCTTAWWSPCDDEVDFSRSAPVLQIDPGGSRNREDSRGYASATRLAVRRAALPRPRRSKADSAQHLPGRIDTYDTGDVLPLRNWKKELVAIWATAPSSVRPCGGAWTRFGHARARCCGATF